MKSKIINLPILFVFLIIEIINFNYNFVPNAYTDLRSSFWLVHFFLSLVYIFITYFIFRVDIGYYDVVIIFFPVLSFFIMILNNIFDMKNNIEGNSENNIEEAYSMDTYRKEKQDENFINFYVDINTIGAYDSLLIKDSKEKKKFLFEFNPPEINFKVEILQKALLDEDIDVIHYAATELNKIDVKLHENIKKAEKSKNLNKIYLAYKEYLNSGLLFDSILKFYQKKTLSILLKLVETDEKNEPELLELYNQINEKDKYETLLKKLLIANPSEMLVEKLMHFLYNENKFREMLDVYHKYKNFNITLPVLFDDFK